MDLDIAASRGLEEAVVQSTEIGAVNSWLRNQPARSSRTPSPLSARRWRFMRTV
jgi:hypothetical protein